MVGTEKDYQKLISYAEAMENIAATVDQVYTKQRLEAISGNMKDLAKSMDIPNG